MTSSHLNFCVHLWKDSQVVLKSITNPDLQLVRFVKRRVDKILSFFTAEAWRYANTTTNRPDVGIRENVCKNSESVKLWFKGAIFLLEGQDDTPSLSSFLVVNMAMCDENTPLAINDKILKAMQTSCDLYWLKKRIVCLLAFKSFSKAKHQSFRKPELNASLLNRAFSQAIKVRPNAKLQSST